MAAERGGCSLDAVPLPPEVRESLAELELELSEGDITQKGYEKKRAKLLARYIPLIQGIFRNGIFSFLKETLLHWSNRCPFWCIAVIHRLA